jgi:hypothetical protein
MEELLENGFMKDRPPAETCLSVGRFWDTDKAIASS